MDQSVVLSWAGEWWRQQAREVGPAEMEEMGCQRDERHCPRQQRDGQPILCLCQEAFGHWWLWEFVTFGRGGEIIVVKSMVEPVIGSRGLVRGGIVIGRRGRGCGLGIPGVAGGARGNKRMRIATNDGEIIVERWR